MRTILILIGTIPYLLILGPKLIPTITISFSLIIAFFSEQKAVYDQNVYAAVKMVWMVTGIYFAYIVIVLLLPLPSSQEKES